MLYNNLGGYIHSRLALSSGRNTFLFRMYFTYFIVHVLPAAVWETGKHYPFAQLQEKNPTTF